MSSICSWMLASKDCEWIVNQTTGKDRSGGPLLFRTRVHSCASSSQVAHRRKRSVQALGSVGPTVSAASALRMGLVQTAVALEPRMIVVITRPRQLLVLPSSAPVLLCKPRVAEAPPSQKARLGIRSTAVTVTVIALTGSATLPTLSAAASPASSQSAALDHRSYAKPPPAPQPWHNTGGTDFVYQFPLKDSSDVKFKFTSGIRTVA